MGVFDRVPQPFDEEGDAMAFGVGLGHGFRHIKPRPKASRAVENNPYYYYPGYVIGYILKAIVLIALAAFGLGAA